MILAHKLAQQIVDRTMDIIDNNINVINHTGVIIGSGDKHRIGEVHDGALLAIKHGDTVEVTESAGATLKGVKPGINLLLKHQGEVIGVVGITGEPDSIRSYAELVKMTAEMIVEQSALTEQLQWDKRHKEEFVTAWVENRLNEIELQSWASRLNIDLTKPRVVTVIEFSSENRDSTLKHIQQAIDILEYPYRDNLVSVMSMNEVAVLKPYQASDSNNFKQTESNRIDKLIERLNDRGIYDVHIGLGRYFPELENIHLSYQSAKQAIQIGKASSTNDHKHLFDAHSFPILLSPLIDSWQGNQLTTPIIKLKAQDKSGQLTKTLTALFENEGNLKECADSLFIHRNTLRYRLNKIEEITQVSPHTFAGQVELYLALQLSKSK
ncbi:sugar diacid recognition domain-containing protein [Vibrio hannami]|uniref:sugar diacid recognition domain-containing protein n=1 Tax=Vibrio hannami TaxID=2717094 RepID=UPI00240EAA56|nr:sugar diacid recognition domain-containing protein [Vibrio hannami]MDG3087350.1 sugar diacid recognition domain-containing protein [Vibrio hannami]